MDFPSTPVAGQTYTFASRVWRFDGEGWRRVVNQGQIVSVFTLLQYNETSVAALPYPISTSWHLVNHI
jgi:hypothetical protein